MSFRRTFLVLLLGSAMLAAQSRPTATRPVNHLAKESSPYLLQHARNPVDWYPWGKEALERSVREDKPIFLSIGYAACHWCHVMEHESFEDPAIAATMNRLFVCVKVDREERPDLDEIYMTAVQALTGRGGWPMSVWLTPQLEPFYAGTYFPPEDRHGMPGFARVLEHIDRLWREKRQDLAAHGRELASVVARHLAPVQTPGAVELAVVDRLVEESRRRFDREFGGWGDAPKFPHASELQLLLRHHARTGEPDSLAMVVQTLERMAKGGIYDQLGGGFHRYSTDRVWLVPHFEKMLYDNALLARVCAETFTLTRRPLFARVLRETLDWMLREMQQEAGGFSATQDADSEGEEGKFFVWQASEIDAVLGERAKAFRAHFGVEAVGNWEHTNVLHWVGAGDELPADLAKARAELLAVRGRRVHPATDDKVLSAWNGMAIAALAIGSRTLDEPRYLVAAQRCARFVLDQLGTGKGRLLRTWRHGEAKLQGYLEDHAFVAEALLELFQCDSDPRWLAAAKELCLEMRRSFRDEKDGSFFATAADHETLIARSKSVVEASQPSGVAMAVLAFHKLGALTGDEAFAETGAAAIAGNRELLERGPSAAPSLLLGLEWQLGDPCEVVVAGAPDDARTQALLAKVHATFPPHHVVLNVHAGNRAALALLTQIVEGKEARNGEPVAFVCRRGTCRAPVTRPEALVLR